MSKSILRVLVLIFISINLIVPQSATSAEPSPATTNGSLVPNYRDPEIPQLQSLQTSIQKNNDQLSVMASLSVKIHSNTLNYIEINLLPKVTQETVNPKLIPPCVKLGTIKATTNNPGGDMQTLQTRSQTADKWYLEQHVVGVTLKLPSVLYPTTTPTYQDLCDGQYVISSIVLKDAASHTITFTANAASTAPVSTSNSSTSSTVKKFTDAPIMQTDFWLDGFPMPCFPATNLAVTTSTTTINGKSTTVTNQPNSASTIRSTCNQSIDFSKVYLNVNGTASGDTGLNGTSKLPIVDYATLGKSAVEENKRLTSQIQVLQSRITILQGGGKVTTDAQSATTNLPIVDYKAKVDELQKQIDALTAQLKGKPVVKATPKPTSKTTAKAGAPSTAKATAKATSSRGNYSQSQRQKWQSRNSATPKPTKSVK